MIVTMEEIEPNCCQSVCHSAELTRQPLYAAAANARVARTLTSPSELSRRSWNEERGKKREQRGKKENKPFHETLNRVKTINDLKQALEKHNQRISGGMVGERAYWQN